MEDYELTDDCKAVLMLSGRFGGDEAGGPKYLTLGEFNALSDWLAARNLRPADLFTEECRSVLPEEEVGRLDGSRVVQLLDRGAALALLVEKWINKGLWIVCRDDPHYPRRLRQHLGNTAPPVLFGVGESALLDQGGMAILGSREVDVEATEYAKEAGRFCAESGVAVISGGAKGVDQLAMRGALEAGGTAAGALADNLMRASVSGEWRQAIRERRLTLISPFNPESSFNVGNAMGRNKCIYALADWALIVSADYRKGGTWAGAEEELRREKHIPVFARIEGDTPPGNRELLKIGARAFPKRPWKEPLQALLADAARPRGPVGEQLSLFGDDEIK